MRITFSPACGVPAVTWKMADHEPVPTVAVEGTVTFTLLLAIVTVAPGASAALLRVMVQLALPAAEREAGLQLNAEIAGGLGTSVKLRLVAPNTALITADPPMKLEPIATVNVALLDPDGMFTTLGAVTPAGAVIPRDTPGLADRLRLTVQVTLPPGISVAGLH